MNEIAYVDWIALPHGFGQPKPRQIGWALPMHTICFNDLDVRNSPANVSLVKNKFESFANQLVGQGNYSVYDQETFIKEKRQILSRDKAHIPLADSIIKLSGLTNSIVEIAASIDQSGIVSIVIHFPNNTLKSGKNIELNSCCETVSILIIHILKLCISDYNAAVGTLTKLYLGSDNEADDGNRYIIPPVYLAPIRVEPPLTNANSENSASNQITRAEAICTAMLKTDFLVSPLPRSSRNNIANRDPLTSDLFKADCPILALSERYGDEIDDVINHAQAVLDNTRGSKSIGRHSEVVTNIFSSLKFSMFVLAFAFFVLMFSPSLQTIRIPEAMSKNDVSVMSIIFFFICFLLWNAVHGLWSFVDGKAQTKKLGLLSKLQMSLAGWFFRYKLVTLWAPVTIFTILWILFFQFWEFKFDILGSQAPGTLTDVMMSLVWLLPALGFGLLGQTYNNYASIIESVAKNGSVAELLATSENLIEDGNRFVSETKRSFENIKNSTSPVSINDLLLRFPDFAHAKFQIGEQIKGRLEKHIEYGNEKYKRNTAIAGFLVIVFGSLGPLSKFKPDDYAPNASEVAAIMLGEWKGQTSPNSRDNRKDANLRRLNVARLRYNEKANQPGLKVAALGSGQQLVSYDGGALENIENQQASFPSFKDKNNQLELKNSKNAERIKDCAQKGIDCRGDEQLVRTLIKSSQAHESKLSSGIESLAELLTSGQSLTTVGNAKIDIGLAPNDKTVTVFADMIKKQLEEKLSDVRITLRPPKELSADAKVKIASLINQAVSAAVADKDGTIWNALNTQNLSKIVANTVKQAIADPAASLGESKIFVGSKNIDTSKLKQAAKTAIEKGVGAVKLSAIPIEINPNNINVAIVDAVKRALADLDSPLNEALVDKDNIATAIKDAIDKAVSTGPKKIERAVIPIQGLQSQIEQAIYSAFNNACAKLRIELNDGGLHQDANTTTNELHNCINIGLDSSNPPDLSSKIAEAIAARLARMPLVPAIPTFCSKNLMLRAYFESGQSEPSKICHISGNHVDDPLTAVSHIERDCSGRRAENLSTKLQTLVKQYDQFKIKHTDQASPYIYIAGYTDTSGAVGTNIHVASNRAAGLKREILNEIEKSKRKKYRISAIGRGEEVRAAEFAHGNLQDDYRSRRADIFFCRPG